MYLLGEQTAQALYIDTYLKLNGVNIDRGNPVIAGKKDGA